MKTTVVPAQVTTVEDKVAGNLTFTQLLLLVIPVFIGGAIFALLPPVFNYSTPKLVLSALIAVVCVMLAIRVKGKILLVWISVITRYRLRPRHYLFNKNTSYLRKQDSVDVPKVAVIEKETVAEAKTVSHIPTSELARVEMAVDDPRANFHFKVRKGGLRVHIREIKEERI